MKEDIINRLATLGYTFVEADDVLIAFVTDKVTNHICNNCNLSEIPLGLKEKAIDMICGEILKVKYSLGLLDIESAVSSIKEGDTQINFSSGNTPEETYLNYINTLASDTIDFARYRKINWN